MASSSVVKESTSSTDCEDRVLPDVIKDKVADGKLNTRVRCERCSCLVLSPGMAKFVSKKVTSSHITLATVLCLAIFS